MKPVSIRGEFEKKGAVKKPVVVEDHQMDVEEVIAAAPEPKVKVVEPRGIVGQKPDFRKLSEPDRTLARLDFLLHDSELAPVFKIAACILVRAFTGVDENLFVKIKDLLPEAEGFTSRTRSGMLAALEERGLIRKKILVKKGVEIELLF